MKKLLPAIFILFAVASGASAQTVVIDNLANPSLPPSINFECCDTFGGPTSSIAQEFEAQTNFSSIQVEFLVSWRSIPPAPTGNYRMELWSDSGGVPSALLAVSNETYQGSLLPDYLFGAFQAQFNFTYSGVIGTRYHIVFKDDINESGRYTFSKNTLTSNPYPFWDSSRESFGSWGFSGSDDFSIKITEDATPPTTPNVITSPLDLDTITTQPFTVSGTCEPSEFISLNIFLIQKETGTIIQSEGVACTLSAFSVDNFGTTAWNGEYILELWGGIPFDPNDTPYVPKFQQIDITINVTNNAITPPPDVTAVIGCNTGQVIADALCDVLAWLFIPDDTSFSKFGDLWDRVKNKPPIGYVTAGLVSWNSVSQGTSSEVLEGTATLSAYFDPMKIAFGSLLWILLLVWIIRRIGSMRI